ncbi:sodium:solute symporter [Leptospira fluminis]|uniref:Sodium:solute symporter n=1 Tax=Leptospira fluminis TaxID=2484979 RepID=A0A4R9GLR3_9LEPT|nr:sodium:solute symporter [Leptospira fluminis]TGK14795.1 sodium:solute symporter [Leptospira fluminis]
MYFGWMDAFVVFVYFALVLYSGWKTSRKEPDAQEFFLAGRTLSWIPLSLSIVATETSALTFLAVPGIAYAGNFTFLQVVLGYILGRLIVALFLLPLTYHGNFMSVYEWVGKRFGRNSQRSMSALFSVTRILGDGVRLYASTLPIAILLEVAISRFSSVQFSAHTIGTISLFLITAVTLAYTMQGGFRSVVWVDTLQYFVYIFGGIFALALLLTETDSIPDIFQAAWNSEKLKFLEWTDPRATYFLPWAVLGGALLSLGTHGADQMFVQRALAARNLKAAQKAMVISGLAVFVQMFLFLTIGTLLYFRYGGKNLPQDKVFSEFLIHEVPSPLIGLLLSGILASTMSTLSSSINSLSLTAKVDFGWKSLGEKKGSFLFGILLFLSSYFFFSLPEEKTKGLLELGLKISSFTVGSMVAVFLTEVIPFLRAKIHPGDLGLSVSLVGAVLGTGILGTIYKFGFTILVPIGMILFWILALGAGILLVKKKKAS